MFFAGYCGSEYAVREIADPSCSGLFSRECASSEQSNRMKQFHLQPNTTRSTLCTSSAASRIHLHYDTSALRIAVVYSLKLDSDAVEAAFTENYDDIFKKVEMIMILILRAG